MAKLIKSRPQTSSEALKQESPKRYAILKNCVVRFWSDKPVSKSDRYEKKYNLTIDLDEKSIGILAKCREAAIMKYLEDNPNDQRAKDADFGDKLWEHDGIVSLTFRSEKDFKLITKVNDVDEDGEETEIQFPPDTRVNKGSIVNVAVNAFAYTANRAYGITYYANGIFVKELEDGGGNGGFDMWGSLRD